MMCTLCVSYLELELNYMIVLFCFVFFAVAKRKSLFDDKSVEIQELTYIIKQDINSLNKQIGQLQKVSIRNVSETHLYLFCPSHETI